MAEFLLGYDLRFPYSCFVPQQWTPSRRAAFLLRPEIETPASVDSLVWPSRFVFPGAFVARHPDGLERVTAPIAHPLQQCLDLWPTADAMAAHFAACGAGGDAIPIAVALCAEPAASGSWTALLGSSAATWAPHAGWLPLGFDIADGSLTSGLSNCGYRDDEVSALRNDWASEVNDFGLFEHLEAAQAFRAVTDARVPEHQPFEVYRLYRGPA